MKSLVSSIPGKKYSIVPFFFVIISVIFRFQNFVVTENGNNQSVMNHRNAFSCDYSKN